jgi:DNA phosphorothioation-dependent restriction protein DptG
MQADWTNELPFSKELFDATEDRGVLVDPKAKRRLIEASERMRRAQE